MEVTPSRTVFGSKRSATLASRHPRAASPEGCRSATITARRATRSHSRTRRTIAAGAKGWATWLRSTRSTLRAPRGARPPLAAARGGPPIPRQPRRRRIPFQAHGDELEAPRSRPGPGHPGEIAETGPHVEQGEGAVRMMRAVERAVETEAHRRGSPQPPVGPRDVAERGPDCRGRGRRVVEQLDAERRGLERAHARPSVMYPPR